MKVFSAKECPQGSDAWWEARRGIPTASNFSRIVTSQGKPSKGMDGYIAELIGDCVQQNPKYFTAQGRHSTEAMRNGTDCEPEARRYYSLLKEDVDGPVLEVGFCLHDSGQFGCSPDGLVGNLGGLELKCPLASTLAGYILKGCLPREYKAQVHGALLVTGREWWDFMAYAAGIAEPLLIRVTRDEFTDALSKSLAIFLEKYAAARAKLLGREPGVETSETE